MIMEFLIGPHEEAGGHLGALRRLVPTLSYATTRFSYWFGPRKRSMKSGGARQIWVELSGFGRFPWGLRMGNNPCDQCLIPSEVFLRPFRCMAVYRPLLIVAGEYHQLDAP